MAGPHQHPPRPALPSLWALPTPTSRSCKLDPALDPRTPQAGHGLARGLLLPVTEAPPLTSQWPRGPELPQEERSSSTQALWASLLGLTSPPKRLFGVWTYSLVINLVFNGAIDSESAP